MGEIQVKLGILAKIKNVLRRLLGSVESPDLPAEPMQELRVALADAEALLRYASEAGVPIDASAVSLIIQARYSQEGEWGGGDPGKLFSALTSLAIATKPVTAATLRASELRARASLRFYQWTAVVLAIIIIPLSLAAFVSSGLSVAITKDVTDGNELALALNTNISGSALPLPSDTRTKLQQFAAIIRAIDGRAQQLNSFVFGAIKDSQLESVRNDAKARRALFELDAASLAVDQSAFFTQIKQKVHFYQDVRYFAKRTQEAAQLVYSAIASSILPILYAVLGACASLLRTFADQIRNRTYVASLANPARLLIAAIGGMVVGLFNITVVQGTSLSPLAVAFLVGYAADAFFSFLDGLLQSLTKAKGSPAP